jgi:hypothetical protein
MTIKQDGKVLGEVIGETPRYFVFVAKNATTPTGRMVRRVAKAPAISVEG